MPFLCLDLDNTLIRSTKAHVQAFKKAFAKNKLPLKTEKEIIQHFSVESSQLIKELYPKLNFKQIKKVVDDHDRILIEETGKLVRTIPGAREALKKVKMRYKVAILSNCKRKEILSLLRYAKIRKDLFDTIIGNDQVTHAKPAPDEVIKAEQIFKVRDGYMVGDSIYDVRAGKRAKVKTIAVLTGTHTRKQLEKERPWKIIKSLRELPKIIRID